MPRLRTHQFASMALVSLIFGILFPRSIITLAAVLLVAWVADWAIDRFGHTTVYTYDGDSHSSRTPMTHSVLSAPIIGFTVGLLMSYLLIGVRALFQGFLGGDPYDVFIGAVGEGAWFVNFLNFNIVMALAGIATAVLHLFLDSLTESGIYVPFKRWRIARVGARDTILNATLKLAALMMMIYVFGIRLSIIGELFPVPLFVLPILALLLLGGTTLTIFRHNRNPLSDG